MVPGSPLLLALGQLPLIVTGDGNTANCPDPAVTQELVQQRVNDLAPANHEIQHAFVTDAQSGHSYVRLRLYNGRRLMLIERLIPADPDHCDDIPLAIAVIVENYFAALSSQPDDQPVPEEGETKGTDLKKPTRSTIAPSAQPTHSTPSTPSSRTDSTKDAREEQAGSSARPKKSPPTNLRSRLFVGLSYGAKRAVSLEIGYDYFFARFAFLNVALNAQVYKTHHKESEVRFVHTIQSLYLGSGLHLKIAPALHFDLSPQLGLHYQRAELQGDNVVTDEAHGRLVASAGAKGLFSLDLADHVWLGIGGRFGAWLGGPRFVLQVPNASPLELYALPRLDWDTHMTVGARF